MLKNAASGSALVFLVGKDQCVLARALTTYNAYNPLLISVQPDTLLY